MEFIEKNGEDSRSGGRAALELHPFNWPRCAVDNDVKIGCAQSGQRFASHVRHNGSHPDERAGWFLGDGRDEERRKQPEEEERTNDRGHENKCRTFSSEAPPSREAVLFGVSPVDAENLGSTSRVFSGQDG